MRALDQPLSPWECFRSRYLGAKPQYRVLPKTKKTPLGCAFGAIKYVGQISVSTPFLPSVVVFAALHTGYSIGNQQTMALLFMCDAFALFIGIALRNLLNIFGLAAAVVAILMSAFFLAADNVYQNICQKLFNKNFKNYPLKNMMQNMEALRRRENALRLHDEDLVLEMNFCVQNCEPETIKIVLTWCNGSSMWQYRHLEALRVDVVRQFKDFPSYTKNLHLFQKEKSLRIAQKQTEEILKAYAIHTKLEKAILPSAAQSGAYRRM